MYDAQKLASTNAKLSQVSSNFKGFLRKQP